MGLRAQACHSRPKRSISARKKERQARERSALRRYRCARCGQLALVCRGCEHNQIYCNRGCAKQARRENQRRAGARHQRTVLGRRNHADRQASYRRRQKQKVTHHTPHPTVAPGQPCTSGPTIPCSRPEKEDSHVQRHAVPDLPPALLLPLAANAEKAVHPSQSSPSLALPKDSQDHVCSFCGQSRSRYLRRDFLVDLSRRPRGRRTRRPP